MVTATDPPLFTSTVRALIWHSLDHHLYRNAIFLAERLLATDTTDEESVHLLALCHYLNWQTTSAYTILKGAVSMKCRYLFAQCCLQLDQLQEGETVLVFALEEKRKCAGGDNDDNGKADRAGKKAMHGLDSVTTRNDTPDEASILCLLGMLCKKANRITQAIEYFTKCLLLNPFMWAAFEGLCQLGAEVKNDSIFRDLTDDALPATWPREPRKHHPPKGKARMLGPLATLDKLKPNTYQTDLQGDEIGMGGLRDIGFGSSRLSTDFFASGIGVSDGGGGNGRGWLDDAGTMLFGRRTRAFGVAGEGVAPGSFLARLHSVDTPSPPMATPILPETISNFGMTAQATSVPKPPPKLTITTRRSGAQALQAASTVPRPSSSSFAPESMAPQPPVNGLTLSRPGRGNVMPPLDDDLDADRIAGVKSGHGMHTVAGAVGRGAVGRKAAETKISSSVTTRGETMRAGRAKKTMKTEPQIQPRRSTRSTTVLNQQTTSSFNSSTQFTRSKRSRADDQKATANDVMPAVGASEDIVMGEATKRKTVKRKADAVQSYALPPQSSIPPLDVQVLTTHTTSSSSANSAPPSDGAITDDRLREAEAETEVRRQYRAATVTALNELLSLLHSCGVGYAHLCQYRSAKALETFEMMEKEQRDTGWVMSKIGRAHFELVDYSQAEKAFQRARQLETHRLDDTEFHSTLLWHLRKDVALSYLAHELVAFDRRSPQAWCAAGNCFSLQKEHDVAIRCFQRAIQLDQSFTYAHTLQGHEYVAVEDYEKATVAFRNAIRVDQRHYNAWYGLGVIYSKIGKSESAEYHFRKAAEINPSNAVLVCCIGMVQEKLKDFDGALQTYNRAATMNPTPLVRFKKAKTLIMLKQYQAALMELKELKELAPEEAPVYFLIGKLYKRLGDRQAAMIHLTWALDLDAKSSHAIRDAIDKLDEPEGDDLLANSEAFKNLEFID